MFKDIEPGTVNKEKKMRSRPLPFSLVPDIIYKLTNNRNLESGTIKRKRIGGYALHFSLYF